MKTILELLGSLVCRFRGHRMKRAFANVSVGNEAPRYMKTGRNVCTRCGLTKPVSSRKTKEGKK